MIAFNGRLACKQYVKGKPNPWGIKVWCVADSATGYLLDFDIYTGKVSDPMPHGSGHYVVTKLATPFFDKYHHVFYDNYFSSVQLAKDLLDRNTYSVSTTRPNRKDWPVELRPKSTVVIRMKQGDVHFRQQGNLVATTWEDKHVVNMLSTNVTPGLESVSRRAPNGSVNVDIPSTVASYNRLMGGVDRFDQLSSYYPVGRTSLKWWRYVFRFLLQTALVNSWILYSFSHCPRPRAKMFSHSHVDFLLSVDSSLIRGNSRKRKANKKQPATSGLGTADPLEHRFIRMVGSKRACYLCSKTKKIGNRNRAPETVYGCNLCQIRLFRWDCFSKFHENLKL